MAGIKVQKFVMTNHVVAAVRVEKTFRGVQDPGAHLAQVSKYRIISRIIGGVLVQRCHELGQVAMVHDGQGRRPRNIKIRYGHIFKDVHSSPRVQQGLDGQS